MSIWFSWGSCSAVAAAIFALTLIANASSSSSQADWLTRRQATNSGLCRIYSYNVERQSTALSWEIGQFGSVQQTFATPERRYFICCQDDGTETACRDKTYQRPHTGTLKPEGLLGVTGRQNGAYGFIFRLSSFETSLVGIYEENMGYMALSSPQFTTNIGRVFNRRTTPPPTLACLQSRMSVTRFSLSLVRIRLRTCLQFVGPVTRVTFCNILRLSCLSQRSIRRRHRMTVLQEVSLILTSQRTAAVDASRDTERLCFTCCRDARILKTLLPRVFVISPYPIYLSPSSQLG